MFHVGQKVVCINDGPSSFTPNAVWRDGEKIVKGIIYTVRRSHFFEGIPCLWLNEVTRSNAARTRWGDDVGYGQWRFRPLIERKTDIGFAILKKICDDTDTKVPQRESA